MEVFDFKTIFKNIQDVQRIKGESQYVLRKNMLILYTRTSSVSFKFLQSHE